MTTTFHLFRRLPSEILLQIWTIILSTPRTVKINCRRGIHPTARRYAIAFTTKTRFPALLHANRETRYETLKVYEWSFHTEYSPNYIYVAFDRDVLKFPEDVLLYVGDTGAAKRIRYLIVEVKNYAYFEFFSLEVLVQMQRLVEVELVIMETAVNADDYGGNRDLGRDCMDVLTRAFEEMAALRPLWKCPKISVVTQLTGERWEL